MDSAADAKSRNPSVLDEQIKNGANLKAAINDNVPAGSPPPEIWMGEAGGAYNSGRPGVTDSFISSFWFLDGFGVLSEAGESTFCRQTLVGGNYGLLQNTPEHTPNPDFFALQLWQTLMGRDVMGVERSDGGADRYFRAYAHSDSESEGGRLTYLLINLSNSSSYSVSLSAGNLLLKSRYVVTSDGLDSQSVYLNGALLEISDGGEFPNVEAMGVEGGDEEVELDPLSYGFFVFEPPTLSSRDADCEAGSEDLCSCSQLIKRGAISTFDECTQEAAIDYCERNGPCE